MPVARKSFRIGRVKGFLRGSSWYLCYHENGQRRRPRIGSELDAARVLAAQTNAQLESGAATALSFEPISIPDLRQRWLDHHEHVLRSSVHTIGRYRTATEHLLRFIAEARPVRHASQFSARDAEAFVQYLRKLEVAPNGHKNSIKRPLMDKGIIYILESCRALFSYAAKRRHLSPYAENPFSAIEIARIPVEDAKPVVLLSPEQEKQFLEACDNWQFPLFLTLMLTGLRPGELTHLLLPDDLDLNAGVLYVRNKPKLGWQVKTRNERQIPLVSELVQVLRVAVGARTAGAVFLRRGFSADAFRSEADLEQVLRERIATRQQGSGRAPLRSEQTAMAKSLWWEMGALREDRVRLEFMRAARKIGRRDLSMPKLLRHQFATALQEGRVDPLIRNQLMGHAPADRAGAGAGLGMTGVYTHSRPETVRCQLHEAVCGRPALIAAGAWLKRAMGSAECKQ